MGSLKNILDIFADFSTGSVDNLADLLKALFADTPEGD